MAKLAGVSVSTVSLALKNKKKVSGEHPLDGFYMSVIHGKIGFVTGPADQRHCMERIRGYKETPKINNIEYDEKIIFQGDFH